uniref:PX domain-containing protein n=1 Tax=Hucho hucho TaxID=62062 RepID=A0A4W5LWP7_9TELE
MSSLPKQLRDESDFDQLPHNIPVSATIADIEEKKGFIDYYRFVMEVRTRGGSKYLIYRRYSQFFNLHSDLELKYSPGDQDTSGPNTCRLPTLPGERGLAGWSLFSICLSLSPSLYVCLSPSLYVCLSLLLYMSVSLSFSICLSLSPSLYV